MDPTPAQALLRKFPAKEVYQPGRMCQCHFRAQREKIFFDPKKLKPGQTGSFLKIPNLSPSLFVKPPELAGCWEVLGGVGRRWEVLGGVGRCWGALGGVGGRWEVRHFFSHRREPFSRW